MSAFGGQRGICAARAWYVVGVFLLAASWLNAQPGVGDEFRVANLTSLNSPADEYAPYLRPDGRHLYFTSSRSGSAKILVSTLSESGWSTPSPVTLANVNTTRDDGALSGPFPLLAQLYPLDEATIRSLGAPPIVLMTSGKRPGGRGDADIYMVRIGDDGALMDEVMALDGINTRRWESQPSIAPDGSFIVFSSDRPGGRGGVDLYITRRRGDGSYGVPMNLGPLVNSSGDEGSPHVAPDGRTLFFSSTGHDGYGGADIFWTRMDERGEFGAPINLGPRINTSANEVFFYGVGTSRCLFASDRTGGTGGLDLYEGTPNIFAPGYSNITWQMRDTVTGKGIGGRIRVIEKSRGGVIADLPVDPARGVTIPMLGGFDYSIEVRPQGYRDTTFLVVNLPGEQPNIRAINYGSPLPPPKPVETPIATVRRDFRLEGITIPLFVSGYYRLNTPELLDDLRNRQQSGDLKAQTYIANVVSDTKALADYRAMAAKVQTKLSEFVDHAVREDFPAFEEMRGPRERIEITVFGYADPRPIIGVYREAPVSFYDPSGRQFTVSPGDSLDNFRLAGLRAAYAADYLDQMLRKASAAGQRSYLDLSGKGLISWRAVSGDVYGAENADDLAEKRRISVEFRRLVSP